ncbi:amidohydrolase family protein [Paeniglutamicibacter antarcticus]|uniref:Amidohydrolase family protein n=1 Tax=Arthrobacter terrae TaxID=2935737 RepID=A0A931G6T5_9MICC|nr:amidohydrolase family protein [Arthrobacter terrae]MBG0741403.1 amidohydrolase family protein [Arthrobacter terrae]
MSLARIPQVPECRTSLRLLGATVIDGTGAAPIPDGEVLIEHGRLSYVGPRRPDIATDAVDVDVKGKTVLPGFFDVHVHMGISLESDPRRSQAMFQEELVLQQALAMRATLMAGVTTVRDLGGMTPGFRNAVADGTLAISGAGDMSAMSRIVDTDDQMRVTVRELLRAGADVIKVCTTGGVSSPSDTPYDIGVPEHQVRIAVEETARRQGQPVVAHAQGARGILEAVRGGVSSVEHGYQITPEAIDMMLAQDTYLVPTLSSALRVPDPAKVPPYLYEKKVVWSAIAREHVTVALQAEVKVALGTDAGVCPHGEDLRELGYLVELGLTPMAAIQAGTIEAARLMRVEEQLGSLETGKLADVVITDIDPLTDITKLGDPGNVPVIVQGGRVVKDLHSWMPVAMTLPALAACTGNISFEHAKEDGRLS